MKDMPDGNGRSPAYDEFMKNVEAGRRTVVIPLTDNFTYILSGEFPNLTKSTPKLEVLLALKLTHKAVEFARADEGEPLYG